MTCAFSDEDETCVVIRYFRWERGALIKRCGAGVQGFEYDGCDWSSSKEPKTTRHATEDVSANYEDDDHANRAKAGST